MRVTLLLWNMISGNSGKKKRVHEDDTRFFNINVISCVFFRKKNYMKNVTQKTVSNIYHFFYLLQRIFKII